MAEGTDETKSVCLSEPVQSRQTDRIGKGSLEGHSQESGCFLFSDLQPAAVCSALDCVGLLPMRSCSTLCVTSSPETNRFYQLGLAHQVREHLERVNRKTEQERDSSQIRDSGSREEQVQQVEVCN